MRRLLIAALFIAAPVFAASQTSFRVGARVVNSATLSARVSADGLHVQAASRQAGMIQVGSAAPVPASADLKMTTPPEGGAVVVTLLY